MPIQVGTLMGMVVVVVLSIHLFHWNISKPLGVFFFVVRQRTTNTRPARASGIAGGPLSELGARALPQLYFLFVAEAVMLETCVIPCVF